MTTQTQLYKQALDTGVLVAQDLAILVKPWVKGATAPSNLFDANGIVANSLASYATVGEIEQKAGAKFTPDVKYNEIMGYGARAARRRLLQTEGMSLDFSPQEVRYITKRILGNLKEGAFQNTPTGGVRWTKEAGAVPLYWSVFVLAEDVNDETLLPIYQWWHIGKMGLDKPGAQSLSMDAASESPATLMMMQDGDNLYEAGIDGPGWASIAADLGFVAASTWKATITGGPSGGTWTFSVGGQTTAGITPSATSTAVRSAIEALPNVGPGKVTVTGSSGGPWTISLSGVTGTPTVDGTGLTGGTTPAVTLTAA